MLDVFTADVRWRPWSEKALAFASGEGLAINPIIYAELIPAFRTEAEMDAALRRWPIQRLELPYGAAWPAARAFMEYRRRGGSRTSPLPDFFIGAHAEAAGLTLVTRDPARFRTYFPTVSLICPTSLG